MRPTSLVRFLCLDGGHKFPTLTSVTFSGIITIFFAVDLAKAKLESGTTWIIVGYVAFHVVSHLILSVNMCWTEHKVQPRSEIYPLTGKKNLRYLLGTKVVVLVETILTRFSKFSP